VEEKLRARGVCISFALRISSELTSHRNLQSSAICTTA
jgi:hypothetical protein